MSVSGPHAFRRVCARWVRFFCALVLLCGAIQALSARAAEPLLLGVHPYLPAAEVLARFQPLAGYLSKAAGRPVTVTVAADYDAHIKRVGTGAVDFGYMGPAPYVELVAEYGPQRLLARQSVNGAPSFHGHIVVADASPLQTMADLKGRRFAFGDAESTMSHMVPYAMMLSAGVAKKDLAAHAFLGSHRNVALAVLSGAFDAGAVKEEIYTEFSTRGLRALAKSPPVSEHLFVASKRMTDADAQAVRTVMQAMRGDPAGRTALTAIKATIDGLVAVTDSDYDPLREMIARSRGGS